MLETLGDSKDYTRRYRQLLLQVFSRDSVLQLIPVSAIPLLLQYSVDGPPDKALSALIPAFGMLFINTPTISDSEEPINTPELRQLSKTLALRAELTFNDLINKRDIIRTPSQPPQSSLRDWEETGSFYGHPPIRHRPYYEGRDDDQNIDASESSQCKKYYSTYKKQKLTGGVMALWCPHLTCLGFHKLKSLAVKDGMMYSLLCMSILNEHRKWSFMTLLVSLVHTACLVSLYSLKILALQLMKCMPKVTLAVHKLRSPATTCKEELCCKM